MTRTSVLVAILNWNSGSTIHESVRVLLSVPHEFLRVLIVDNGSTDGSTEALTKEFPAIHCLRNGVNMGVAGGFNQALAYAEQSGDGYIVLLNSDATITAGGIAQLVEVMVSDPLIAACTPRIMDASRPGQVWFDGGVRSYTGLPVHKGLGHKPSLAFTPHDEYCMTGCIVLLRVPSVIGIGGFDNALFAYGEDTDASFRLIRQGYRLVHVPAVCANHHPSASLRANAGKWLRDYYTCRNSLLLWKKYRKDTALHLPLCAVLWKYVVVPVLYFIMSLQGRRVAWTVRGVYDFVQGSFGECKKGSS